MQTKLPEAQGSIYWKMRNMALTQGALDMSLGITEFACHQGLAESACRFIHDQYNNHAPVEGIPSLREKLSERFFRRYGKRYIPETEITICAGAIQAVSTAITASVSEGDEVIIFEPFYFAYSPSVKLNGGTPVYVPLQEPDFRIEWDDVRKMITTKTRLIIVNTPHNATGSVLSHEDMLQLQRLTNGTGILVISDESFEYLIYDQQKHQSAGQFDQLTARSFIISSPGPLYHINGWNLAWCMAPENLMNEFRKIHEYQIFSVTSPLQYALADFFETTGNEEEITEFYQGKRNYFNRLLKGSPYYLIPTQGTCFQLVNYSKLSQESDADFAMRLLNEAGVAAMPLSVFMHKKENTPYLRFCFAKKNETLEDAADRMIRFAATISGR